QHAKRQRVYRAQPPRIDLIEVPMWQLALQPPLGALCEGALVVRHPPPIEAVPCQQHGGAPADHEREHSEPVATWLEPRVSHRGANLWYCRRVPIFSQKTGGIVSVFRPASSL